MAGAKKPKDVNERMLDKLERIEDLLVKLISLEACIPNAQVKKVAAFIGVTDHQVSAASGALKRQRAKKGKKK